MVVQPVLCTCNKLFKLNSIPYFTHVSVSVFGVKHRCTVRNCCLFFSKFLNADFINVSDKFL